MPGIDSTGPAGEGPMTGRGMGRCSGNANPGFLSCRGGRGVGRGRMNAQVQPGGRVTVIEMELQEIKAMLAELTKAR
ncbi:MAG: DUF5320 domain-containing protein [Spirochaetia bacterium]|nr:DUF5320 domain-containing protein [Spirochaetia bacterium]